MTYQIIYASNETEQVWDQYVEQHSLATPYHRYAWVKSVEQAYAHKNVSLIAYQDNKLVGILPTVKMQRPFSKVKYCSLPFCDLGYGLADNDNVLNALIDFSLQKLAAEHGNVYEYRDSNTDISEECSASQKVRMLLPLALSSDLLMADFKSKLRSQIRKAEKNGLTYSIDNSQKQIDDFYQIFAINMRKLGSPVHSKKWFEALFSHYQDNIVLSVVYSEGTPIGAGIVIRNNNKASIPWASTVAEYNKLAPNMMLYWSLLKHLSDSGCKEFDFGRSSFGEGTFRFKQQWGAKPVPLNWTDLAQSSKSTTDNNGEASHEPSKIRPLVENIWAKLPLGVTTSLGPKIRKHISL